MHPAHCMTLLALAGCAAQSGAPSAPDTLAWHLDSLHQEMPDCADAGVPCVEVTLQWVVVISPDSAVADSIAAQVERMTFANQEGVVESRDAMVANLFSGFREFRADFPDAPGGWFDQREMSVACNSAREFVVRLDVANHFGGAHPNSATVFASFDAATGKTTDWRTNVDQGTLLPVAERHFRAARELPDSGSLNGEGWYFDNDRFTLPSQGMWCDGNLALRYNPYESGPYVLGPTEFTIPAAELPPR